MQNFQKFYIIFHLKQLNTLYTYPNYLSEKNMKRNISVLTFIYVFQMTTVKRSCCWGGDGTGSSSRTEIAHYLQNHVHTGVSED